MAAGHYADAEKLRKAAYELISGMDWESSKRGFDYWRDVHDALAEEQALAQKATEWKKER